MSGLELHAVAFGLVLIRVSVFFFALPLFGWQGMPVRFRLGLAVACTAVLTPVAGFPSWIESASVLGFVVLGAREVVYGAAVGFGVSFVFHAVSFSARVIERQMGLAFAAIVDPLTGEQEGPLSRLYMMLAVLVLLAVNGHHVLLLLLQRSYQEFPVGSSPALGTLAAGVLQAAADSFVLGLRCAAPVLVLLFVASIALAILTRVVPEINMLFLSLPVRLGLGVAAVVVFLPSVSVLTGDIVQYMASFWPA